MTDKNGTPREIERLKVELAELRQQSEKAARDYEIYAIRIEELRRAEDRIRSAPRARNRPNHDETRFLP